MFNWLRELYEIRRDNKICTSCETLKMQLAIVNQEKKVLLDSVLSAPEKVVEQQEKEYKPILPRTHTNWNVRRQMLEAEDRKKAQLVKQKVELVSTEDLEKELNVVEKEREKENAI